MRCARHPAGIRPSFGRRGCGVIPCVCSHATAPVGGPVPSMDPRGMAGQTDARGIGKPRGSRHGRAVQHAPPTLGFDQATGPTSRSLSEVGSGRLRYLGLYGVARIPPLKAPPSVNSVPGNRHRKGATPGRTPTDFSRYCAAPSASNVSSRDRARSCRSPLASTSRDRRRSRSPRSHGSSVPSRNLRRILSWRPPPGAYRAR